MKIYLAGGMHGNWRAEVKALSDAVTWIDPCDHNLKNEWEYTLWDLQAIKDCDLVFAYLEENNPGGEGMNLEIGFAHGLGIYVILVDEKWHRYGGMARSVASVAHKSFKKGLIFLEEMLKLA